MSDRHYDCHKHGVQAGESCPLCTVHVCISAKRAQPVERPRQTDKMSELLEELTDRIRMLNDIALSAVALKLNLEHGITAPSLHALNRDLNAYQKKYEGVKGNGA